MSRLNFTNMHRNTSRGSCYFWAKWVSWVAAYTCLNGDPISFYTLVFLHLQVMWCYVSIALHQQFFWSCQSQPSTATNFSMGHRDVVAEGRMSRLLQHLDPQLPYKRSTASLSNIGKIVDAIKRLFNPSSPLFREENAVQCRSILRLWD